MGMAAAGAGAGWSSSAGIICMAERVSEVLTVSALELLVGTGVMPMMLAMDATTWVRTGGDIASA